MILKPIALIRKSATGVVIVVSVSLLAFSILNPTRASAIIPQVISETCALTTACETIGNTATGPAVLANSASGVSVIGRSTSSYGVTGSTKASGALAGVAGFDDSKPGVKTDAGVYGTSPMGVGVEGVSQQGTGVQGSSSSNGIVGSTTSTAGASGVVGFDNGTSISNSGVAGHSNSGRGVAGYSNTGDGVAGLSGTGYGLYGQSAGIGIVAFGALDGMFVRNNGAGGIGVVSVGDGPTSKVFVGINGASNQEVVTMDNAGNEVLAGTLTQSGQSMARTTTSNGNTVAAYNARTSSPTLEDFGEARLVNGQVYVSLDETFAFAIDSRSKYMVFLSPQGDNRGLYVTGVTKRGFLVRESNGGHSTLTFDYRIVAKPYDTDAVRFAPTAAFSGLRHDRALPVPVRRS